MPEQHLQVVDEDDEYEYVVPFHHKFGKFMACNIASFGAGLLADRLYDIIVEAWNNRRNSI